MLQLTLGQGLLKLLVFSFKRGEENTYTSWAGYCVKRFNLLTEDSQLVWMAGP